MKSHLQCSDTEKYKEREVLNKVEKERERNEKDKFYRKKVKLKEKKYSILNI